MKYYIFFLLLLFVSCKDTEFPIAHDISKIEEILKLKIQHEYEIIEEENIYPIKGNIVHFVSFQFHPSDYENILHSALLFFTKSTYDPLNPSKNLDIIYYEIEDEEQHFRYSIYIDMKLKKLDYSSIDLK